MGCTGNSEGHCCWVNGKPCRFLETNTHGRKWACGLRIKHGSWDKVHQDEGYLKYVKPVWDKCGITDCGDWPSKGQKCNECGLIGS